MDARLILKEIGSRINNIGTIDISESTTAPTNISEWSVNYGLFGNITSPEITSLEQRVAALESKV